MKPDVLIIGAGLSGLAAGIRLAHFGKSTCIVERHRLPGGLNSYYRRRGRVIDTGLHAVTNFASKQDRRAPLNRLMRQLRLSRDDFELCPQRMSTIEGPGVTLRFSNDIADLECSIAQAFPQHIDAFRRLVQRVRSTDLFTMEAVRVPARPELETLIPDPRLRDLVLQPIMYYGNAEEDDMDMNHFMVLFYSVFLEGLCRPLHGMHHVLETLVHRFQDCGGDLRLGCGVRTLECDGKSVTKAILDDGSEVAPKQILSCAGLPETLGLCDPSLPPEQRVPPGQVSIVETIFFLDRHPADLGLAACVSFINQAPRFYYGRPDRPVDDRSTAISIPGNYLDHQHAADADQVRVTGLADHRAWFAFDDDAYRAAKDEVIRRQTDMMERRAPGFADAVVDADMFTPRTIHRYTGRLNGALYGSPEKSRRGTTMFDNLFVAGTDQGFLGIVGSLLSGVTVANQYLVR